MLIQLTALICRIGLLGAGGLLGFCLARFGIAVPAAGWLALAAGSWSICRQKWFTSGNFGTGRFATLADAFHWKLTGHKGWVMGRLNLLTPPTRGQALRLLLNPLVASDAACRMFLAALFPRWGDKGLLRIPNGIHAATFAPAGAGKSTRVLVPNLLSYRGSCVVIDPKGELYKLTSRHRRWRFGHKIVLLDPAKLCGDTPTRFNPLDWIDPHAPDFVDRCRDLANMLVVRKGTEPDAHWNDAAERVIAAMIAFVCAKEPDKTLRNFRNLRTLVASRENYTYALERMKQTEGFNRVLEQFGGQLGWHVGKELGSVMTHVQRHTDIFDSPLVADSTAQSDWDPTSLRSGKVTVYLVIPSDKLVVWSSLVRVWLGSILRIITRGGTPSEKRPVLFLVDEAAQLGKLRVLSDAITLMRGYGIRVWLFFQSLNQLTAIYGEEATTILDNLATQQYFGITSFQTAEAISNRIGDTTVVNWTDGSNSGYSWSQGIKSEGRSQSRGNTTSYTEGGRKVIFPTEILQLRKSTALVFHQNCPVLECQTVEYFRDKAFRRCLPGVYGTGGSGGLGLGGVLLSLMLLGWAALLTMAANDFLPPAGPAISQAFDVPSPFDGLGQPVKPVPTAPQAPAPRRASSNLPARFYTTPPIR